MNPALGTRPRIGVLGGTFNPVHMGHLILAQTACETHELSKVLFIPCATPPHKDTSALIPAAHRLAMVQAAIEGDLRFEASDIEIQRGGVSYAVDTVRTLVHGHPESDLIFIIGADMLPEIHLWRQIYDLLPLCAFATFARPGVELARLTATELRLAPPWPDRLLRQVTATRLIEVSSSDIRYRIAEGLSIRYLVPAAVEMYILEHGLYGQQRRPPSTD